ncbi:unnamed protein product [Darwinula stevensoni]|uniref:Cytochrome b561 domain-containing protein n=1 Tax=Darwinula stevensoni TaxID=69355 RepID=A0A7R8X7D7_9CRUS|nr:unnamed protein product [Darwinula stevensoni]CAG0883136.1 unnamed protein product [Darwinula stevensoni]
MTAANGNSEVMDPYSKGETRFTGAPHRKSMDEEDGEWTGVTRVSFGVLLLSAVVLLWGALGLVIYWVMQYQGGFAWTEDPKKEFNLHPTLMIAGFIFFMGHALLVYRSCRCCKRIYNKLVHTIFHLCALPCIAVAVITVFDSHNLASPPIPNLYSLHSWLGLVTMGLFALQFVVGFFSFLILLCCEGPTAGFRAALVPIHGTMGLVTFMLAIATAVTGLTEKAFFSLQGGRYQRGEEEGIVINSLGMVLVGLAVVLPLLIRHPSFSSRLGPV